MQFKEFAVLNVPRGGTGGVWRVDLAAQNASIAATDLVSAGSVDGGLYMVKGIVRVTTMAGTSGSVNVQINYTDDDLGTVVAGIPCEGFKDAAGLVTTPTNNIGVSGIFSFSRVINARKGVSITYVTAYASNPAAAMIYSLHLLASKF